MVPMDELENSAIELMLKSSLMMLAAVEEEDRETTSEKEFVERISPTSPRPICKRVSMPKRKKRLWIEKWREEKQSCGNVSLFSRYSRPRNSESFRHFILMDESIFSEILAYITGDIRKQDTVMRTPVPPDQKLSITLRFLATGESFNALNYETGYSNKFLSESVIEVCNAICSRMQDVYLKFPGTKEEWLQKADQFLSRLEFPHCLGALDCKHIQFIAPKRERDSLFVEKAFNSVTLLALADSDCKFTFVDIGRHGPIKDKDILEQSHLIHILRQGQQHLPPDAPIGQSRCLPYVLIADEAFPLEKHLMKPYSGFPENPQKKIFNARLSHARQCIQRALGILCNRFRVLQTRIYLNHHKVRKLVLCCCILHNLLMEKSAWYREQILSENDKDALALLEVSSRKITPEPTMNTKLAEPIRNSFAEYFFNEGSSPWQQNYVELIEVETSFELDLK